MGRLRLGFALAAEYDSSILRSMEYVDRILRGAKPSDLPVYQPRTYELILNLKTAKALDLTIPASLRQRAARLIE